MSQDNAFAAEVHRLRSEYETLRNAFDTSSPRGRPNIDGSIEEVDGVDHMIYWKECDGSRLQYVRLANIPGTLSGNILRLRANLPFRDDDYEIVGDKITALDNAPEPPVYEDDAEDLTTVLATLPLIDVDPNEHFTKQGRYESEVRNLLKCQGGKCPGVPVSPHIIQLLGKSCKEELVFPRLNSWPSMHSRLGSLAACKRWILHLIDGLKCLHSLGIIHRDLKLDNLLLSPKESHLVICDLEEHWGAGLAPELPRRENIPDIGHTDKSDIYDIGNVIKCMIYNNNPRTVWVEWPVPAPLDAIVEACMRHDPEQRPSLEELRVMVEAIESS